MYLTALLTHYIEEKTKGWEGSGLPEREAEHRLYVQEVSHQIAYVENQLNK